MSHRAANYWLECARLAIALMANTYSLRVKYFAINPSNAIRFHISNKTAECVCASAPAVRPPQRAILRIFIFAPAARRNVVNLLFLVCTPPFSARCSRVKLACGRPIWSKRPKCEICAYAATQSANGCEVGAISSARKRPVNPYKIQRDAKTTVFVKCYTVLYI